MAAGYLPLFTTTQALVTLSCATLVLQEDLNKGLGLPRQAYNIDSGTVMDVSKHKSKQKNLQTSTTNSPSTFVPMRIDVQSIHEMLQL